LDRGIHSIDLHSAFSVGYFAPFQAKIPPGKLKGMDGHLMREFYIDWAY
jgi:hypothetical protein